MDDNEVNSTSPGELDEFEDLKGTETGNGSENLLDLGFQEPTKPVEQAEEPEDDLLQAPKDDSPSHDFEMMKTSELDAAVNKDGGDLDDLQSTKDELHLDDPFMSDLTQDNSDDRNVDNAKNEDLFSKGTDLDLNEPNNFTDLDNINPGVDNLHKQIEPDDIVLSESYENQPAENLSSNEEHSDDVCPSSETKDQNDDILLNDPFDFNRSKIESDPYESRESEFSQQGIEQNTLSHESFLPTGKEELVVEPALYHQSETVPVEQEHSPTDKLTEKYNEELDIKDPLQALPIAQVEPESTEPTGLMEEEEVPLVSTDPGHPVAQESRKASLAFISPQDLPVRIDTSEKMSGDGPSTLFKHVDPRALELVYWRRPIKSGVVLLALFALQIGLVFCSVISVIAYTGLAILVASASLRVYSHFLKKTDHPFKDYLETDNIISRDQTEELTRKILGKFNQWILCARDVFLISNYVESLKFAAILYILTYIGARFNFLTLCILCTVSVFTLPKIYETYQTQIDQLLSVVKAKLNDLLTIVRGKVETLPVVGKKMKSN